MFQAAAADTVQIWHSGDESVGSMLFAPPTPWRATQADFAPASPPLPSEP
jgi:hypothetical protein